MNAKIRLTVIIDLDVPLEEYGGNDPLMTEVEALADLGLPAYLDQDLDGMVSSVTATRTA